MMTISLLQQLLLCIAAACCWRRFNLIFSAATDRALLLAPTTSVATAVFLCSAGLVVTRSTGVGIGLWGVATCLMAVAMSQANSARATVAGATFLGLYLAFV